MPRIVYRPAIWTVILGVALIVFGGWATWVPIEHLNSGEPWWISSSRYSHGTHVASRGEMMWHAIMYSSFPLVGAFLIVARMTTSVVLDMDGVIYRSLGVEKFRARYEELASIVEMEGRNGAGWFVLTSSSGRRTTLPSNFGRSKQMAAEIRSRAPHLAA